MMQSKFRRWLLCSFLAGLAAALMWGLWSMQTQKALAEDVIRLHVIAASDSREDQALKLKVRDAVLAETENWLSGAEGAEDAETILRKYLPRLQNRARSVVREAGYSYPVRAILAPETYPTREYGTFSLPGGEYMSLRIILDEGKGHNWWCVVFPPLCTAAVTDTVPGLTEEEMALITQKDGTYVFRFKSIELWNRIRKGL